MAALPQKSRTLDALTSATLKHVRDDWWDEAFTAFLVERLRPRVGNRILDVGCGTGWASAAMLGRFDVEVELRHVMAPGRDGGRGPHGAPCGRAA